MPYHLSSAGLEEGSVILPGNWGRTIRKFGWQHGRAIYETILEHVRAQEFSHLPSRLECAFFFDDENEARFYWNGDLGRTLMRLYEVEILDPSRPVHRTDWRGISPQGPLDTTWAKNYWRGRFLPPEPNGHSYTETLMVTRLRVIREFLH